ncbi:hypothetical protein QFZ89_008150 [Paraburkholderia youngii]
MSGKRTSSRLRGIVVLLGLFVGARAHSSGVPDLLEDPLLTRPPLLNHGTDLQGETPAVTCPTAIDLAQPLTLARAIDIGLCNNPQFVCCNQNASCGGRGSTRVLSSNAVGSCIAATYPDTVP